MAKSAQFDPRAGPMADFAAGTPRGLMAVFEEMRPVGGAPGRMIVPDGFPVRYDVDGSVAHGPAAVESNARLGLIGPVGAPPVCAPQTIGVAPVFAPAWHI